MKGDNDPVDVVEIGSQALAVGSVTKVKPLGVLAMIDDGELDWKVRLPRLRCLWVVGLGGRGMQALGWLVGSNRVVLRYQAAHHPYSHSTPQPHQIIAINAADPLANELNDIADVEKKLPGVVSGIREWFRWYKTPDDKPVNEFGFGEKALPKADALKVGGAGEVLVDLVRTTTTTTQIDPTAHSSSSRNNDR